MIREPVPPLVLDLRDRRPLLTSLCHPLPSESATTWTWGRRSSWVAAATSLSMDRTQQGSARATWTVRTPALQHPWPECPDPCTLSHSSEVGHVERGCVVSLSRSPPLKNPEGPCAQLMLSPPDSVSFHLPLWTVALSPPYCPSPWSCRLLPPHVPVHLSLTASNGPGAGPSAGQGAGDDRLLPLAAAGWRLRVASVRGHRGRERQEPRGAPCALGQLRAQVRAPQGTQDPSTYSAISPQLGGLLLFEGAGLLKEDKPRRL